MIAKAKLGQSILGFTFAFIIIAALSIGLTRIWAWYNINFGSRQVRYQASRPTAASPGYYGGDEEHPNVYITHAYNPDYKPIDLTEQWVFRGATTERTPYEMPPFGSLEDAANVCKTACPECVTSVPDPDNPGHTIDTIDVNCPCYVRCMCDQRVAVQIQMYNEQMKALRDASCSMIREAEHMEDEAERCDDPWELCWWGGFGVPSKKLRDAARSLRQQAARLCNYSRCCGTNECCGVNSQVGIILRQRNAVSACCDHDTQDEQDICLADIAATQCGPVRDGYIADWNESIRLLSCERSFAIYIRNTIDNMYGRPAPDRGCQKWADYQCRYACEVPEVAVCEQEVRDGCTTDCQAYCTTNCTCIPPTCDPPVFDAACYADCEANQCVDNGDGHIDTWYEVCVNDRMTDPALPQSYNNCIAAHIAACVVACPGSAEWNRNYEQCCQSFCCSDCCAPNPPPANCAASTPCGFGVLDRRYWSYNRQYRIRPIFGDGWECIRNCDCCPIGSADGCTWVTPGRIGDGCITTWQARYPEWATYATWCGEAANRQDRWWGRSCTSPSTFCDADCEDVSPPPAACFVAPTVLQPSGIVVNPSGLAMCGLQEFANRQNGTIAYYQGEIDKFNRKIAFINGCCNILGVAPGCAAAPPASCIEWILNEDNPPNGTCKVRNEDGSWPADTLPGEMDKFACMSKCMEMASSLGEEAEPGLDLEELCGVGDPWPGGPNCFTDPPLSTMEFADCISACVGVGGSECCSQWCVDNRPPEQFNACFADCLTHPTIAPYNCPP